MKGDVIKANILSAKIISNINESLAEQLGLFENERSIGLVTSDSDDVTYVALDEATKKANVRVVYAKSLYAGSSNASTKLAGEIIGVIAGETPADVKSGLDALIYFAENEAHFISANDDDSIVYFAHCVSRPGKYLSDIAGTNGESIAYLIAPPEEALIGLDAALKGADVEIASFYGPPSETNFAGGLLKGSQSSCKAACESFAAAIYEVAEFPKCY